MICQYCGHKLTDGKCLNPACPGRLRGTPHQSLLELGNILFHDARPTNEIESTGIKKYWLSKSRIIPYKKKSNHIRPSKDPKMRELENAYIVQGAILEWIQMILDGIEVSDFALSYPIVRQVWDLKQEASHE